MLFGSVGFFRATVSGRAFPALVWYVPSLFWVIEFAFSLWSPYVKWGGGCVEIRRWIFLPRIKVFTNPEFLGRAQNGQIVLFLGEDQVASVARWRMSADDWGRFLKRLGDRGMMAEID